MIAAELTLVGQYNPDAAARLIQMEAIGVLRGRSNQPYDCAAIGKIVQTFGVSNSLEQDHRALHVIHITLVYAVDERFFAEVQAVLWGKLTYLYRNSIYKGHLTFETQKEDA